MVGWMFLEDNNQYQRVIKNEVECSGKVLVSILFCGMYFENDGYIFGFD